MPLLCVSSPKGGVGKTTLAANLSAQFVRQGHRVVVIDLDPQNALGLHFGMALDRTAGFMTLLGSIDPSAPHDQPEHAQPGHAQPEHAQPGHAQPGQAGPDWRGCLQRGPDGVQYLPFGQTDLQGANTLSLALTIAPHLLSGPIAEMLADGLLVVIDLPPGPSLSLPIVLPLADLLLVVLLVDATSIAQIPAIESGRAYGLSTPLADGRIGFVMNQLDLRTRLGRASIEAVARHLGDRLLGVVYRDESVPEAIASQALVAAHAQHSKAAQDIATLALTIAPLLYPQAGQSAGQPAGPQAGQSGATPVSMGARHS